MNTPHPAPARHLFKCAGDAPWPLYQGLGMGVHVASVRQVMVDSPEKALAIFVFLIPMAETYPHKRVAG